jgi:pyrimidine-specific ribonucleoside hydrolase
VNSIIIDCDPGHDDAVALMLALASEEVELLGVTTVAGNQTVERTTENAIRVLDHVGPPGIPVSAGAGRPLVRELQVAADVHGDTGLDGADLPPPTRQEGSAHAIDWIASAVFSSRSPVTLVATGPLTNVALLLARYPELEGRLERIVFMGGAIGEGNITPAAEFNVWVDPEAARRVFSSSVDLTMVGLDVTHRALLTSTHLESLAALGNEAGRLLAGMYGFYLPVHEKRYGWSGAPVHDAVALAHVIDPGLLTTASCGVRVDTSECSRGRTNVDLWAQMNWQPTCHVATDINAEAFIGMLLERIARLR